MVNFKLGEKIRKDSHILNEISYFQLLTGPMFKDQTRNAVLNPPIETQYLRINPQYWSSAVMCLKTELYGCSGKQGLL